MKPVRTVLRSVAVGVVLMWLFLQLCTAETVVHHHPPVLEGNSVTLLCEGNTSSNQRNLVWQVKNSDQPILDAAICLFEPPSCDNYLKPRYFAEILCTEKKSCSTYLTVVNVTFEEKDQEFFCAYYNDSHVVRLAAWDLSNIFVVPESPKCKASSEDGVNIHVSCSTPRVYPHLTCIVDESGDNGKSVSMTTRKESARSEHNCSTDMPLKPPGLYSFRVTMFPGLRVINSDSLVVYVDTNLVNVTSEPVIKLDRYNLNVCQREMTTPSILCTVYWLPAKPTFIWHVDSVNVTGNFTETNTIKGSNSAHVVYASGYSFTDLTSSSSRRRVECIVKYNASGGPEFRYIKDTKDIEIIVAPQTPVFKHHDGRITARNKIFRGSATDVKFLCEAEGGIPPVSSIEIECKNLSETKRFQANSTQVSAHISYLETSKWECTCFAQHVSKCNRSTPVLTVFMSFESYSSVSSQAETPQIALYILIAAASTVIFAIFVASLLFLKKRCPFEVCWEAARMHSRTRDQYRFVHGRDITVSGALSAAEEEEQQQQQQQSSVRESRKTSQNKISVTGSLKYEERGNGTCGDMLIIPSQIQSETAFTLEKVPSVHLSKGFDYKPSPWPKRCLHDENSEVFPPRLPPRQKLSSSSEDILWTLALGAPEDTKSSHTACDNRSLPKPCRVINRTESGEFFGGISEPCEKASNRVVPVSSLSPLGVSLKKGNDVTPCSCESDMPENDDDDDDVQLRPQLPPRQRLVNSNGSQAPDVLENL